VQETDFFFFKSQPVGYKLRFYGKMPCKKDGNRQIYFKIGLTSSLFGIW